VLDRRPRSSTTTTERRDALPLAKRKLAMLDRPHHGSSYYRERAGELREIAVTLATPELRDPLLDLAEQYERLAQRADDCAAA
jgi:hypothetical protein